MSEPGLVETRARRRWRWSAGLTTLAGLAVLGAADLTARSWRADLPDPVASHWGADGGPNGFSSLDALLRTTLAGGLVLVLGFGAITWWLGHSSLTRRIGAAGTIWSALFIATLTVGTLNGQRGLADAHDAGGVNGVLALAFAGPLVVAVVVGFLVPGDPRQPTTAPVDPGAPRAALPQGAATTWTGSATSRTALLIGVAAAALVLAVVVWTQLWVLAVAALMLFAVVAAMASAVVRVDGTGVVIRSPLGWPRTRVPLDEITRADVTRVRPVRDFGGWGWRVGRDGRVGVVLRAGEALLVERTGGRSVVVTVDGAAEAAGLVNALADRARGQGQAPGR